MARWEEAYDALLDAYLYVGSPRGKRYLEGWLKSIEDGAPGETQPGGVHYRIQDKLEASLFNAEPVWVDPDMMILWEAALETFVEEPLMETDLPTDVGFVWLPRPHYMEDVRDLVVSNRAYMWAKVTDSGWVDGRNGERVRGDGVMFAAFHRTGDIDDHDDGSMGRKFPGGVMEGDLTIDWWYIAPFNRKNYDLTDPRVKELSAVRPIQCLLRLMQQTIATREELRPQKPWRRRWERGGLDQKKVVVVRLRRPQSRPTDEHRSVEWDHQWVVSGHWRNQWYPSLGAHRQIWISAHVKGPEDKELMVRKARVWELVQ